MDNFENELANLTIEERSIVIDKLKSELSHEQSQLVRDVIMQRANNVPYATIIQSAIDKYIGKSVQELANTFDLNVQSKSLNRNIISCILDIEGLNEGHDRFSKEMIKIKSVTLNDKNKFNNGMSLNPFSFEGIVEEEWETSSLRLTFKKNIFLFVIFKEETPANIILEKCITWTIDNGILDTKIKEVWEIVKENLINGKVISFIDINKRMKTTFPSTTFNGICFVAAHAHSKKDTSKLPVTDKLTGITDLTKHSFWLTKDYLYDILGISNDISLKNQEQDDVLLESHEQDDVLLDIHEQDDVLLESHEQDDVLLESHEQDDVLLENCEQDDIRVPVGFDTAEHSVTVDEDVNKIEDTHISEEIEINFDNFNTIDSIEYSNLEMPKEDSIDDLIASLRKKPVEKPVEAIIEDSIEITLNNSFEESEVDFDEDDEIEFEDISFDDEFDMDDIMSSSIEDDLDDIEIPEIPDFDEPSQNLESPETFETSEETVIQKPQTRKKVAESNDPIIDRFSGTESVATLTARLESNLRKLEAEYSTGLGTLSPSGKYSLRGRIEKRIASEMNGDMLTYEHLEVVDPKVKKMKEKQLKKAEKKQKKLK